MSTLFGKPYGEVRAAFTKRRLESEAYFGVRDVGIQIERELLSSEPTVNFPWMRVMNKLDLCRFDVGVGRITLMLVEQFCTPYPDDRAAECVIGRLGHLIRALDPARANVYVGDMGNTLITTAEGNGYHLRTTGEDEQPQDTCRLVNPSAPARHHQSLLADLLLTEWRQGRSNWKQARAFLCQLMTDNLMREANEAREQFNQAVAVSADLTRLVHADHVICYFPDGSQPIRLYPAAIFRKPGMTITRLVHSDEDPTGFDGYRFKRKWCDGIDTVASFTAALARIGIAFIGIRGFNFRQSLFECKDGSVFISPIDNFAGLLPDGYRELSNR